MRRFVHLGAWMAVMICLFACVSTPVPPTPTAPVTSTARPTATASLTPSPTLFVYPMRLERVGQIGGRTDALALSGDTVYLRVGARVLSVDVSNLAKPTVTGCSPILPGSVKSVAALDHFALAGDGEGTLWVFDTPDVGDLLPVARLETGDGVYDIAVAGDIAYLAAGTAGLVAVDLSDPAHPDIIARLALESIAFQIALTGQIAVVGSDSHLPGRRCDDPCSDTKLNIVDVSDPARPVLLNATTLTYPVRRLAVTGNIVYVDTEGTSVFDIADPARPQLVSSSGPEDIDVAAEGYAFSFGSRYSTYSLLYLFSIYDISDPIQPVDVTSAIRPLPADSPAVGNQIIVRGRLAYVATHNGLAILDLAVEPVSKLVYSSPPDVYAPDWKLLGWLQTDVDSDGYGCCGWAFDLPYIFVAGDYLHSDSNVWSLDNPSDPQRVAAPANDEGKCFDFKYLRGGYTFLDRRDPASPVCRDVMLSDPDGYTAGQSGNLVFLVTSRGPTGRDVPARLEIYDVVDPARPALVGTYAPFSEYRIGNPFVVMGDYVLYEYGLNIGTQFALDISDPSNPRPADIAAPRLESSYYATSDDTLFVLDENRLKVFTANDLSTPVATLDTPIPPGPSGYSGPQSRVEYADGLIVISTYLTSQRTYMTTAIDVHDPAHPRLLAVNDASFYIAVGYKEHLYLYSFEDGISILRLCPTESQEKTRLMQIAETFLEHFTAWAGDQPLIDAAALIGSYARGDARPDSDVDLVLITRRPERFLDDDSWLADFGTVESAFREDWGLVQSVRVFYAGGLEVEFGVTTPEWTAVPPDPGTAEVVAGGMVILMDRDGRLAALKSAVDARTEQ